MFWMAPRLTVPAPTFDSTGSRARNVGAGGPGGSGGVNYSLPAQRIDTTVSDFAEVAGKISQIAEQINFERDAVKAVGVENKAVVAGQERMNALNPLDADYQDKVKAIWADVTRSAKEEGGITNSRVADDLSKRMDRHSATAEMSALTLRKAAVNDEGVRTFNNGAEATYAKIRQDPGNSQLYIDEFKADAARLQVGIDPTKLGPLNDKFQEGAAVARTMGYAERGNFGAARQSRDDSRAILSNGAYLTLSNQIDAKENKARADGDRWRSDQLAGVLVDINDKANEKKPWVGDERARLDDMQKRGILGPKEYYSAVSALNQAEHKQRIEQSKNNIALNEWQTGSTSSQENLDRAYRIMMPNAVPVATIASQGSPEDWNKAMNTTLAMSDRTKYIPSDAKNFLENADSNTNPNDAKNVSRAAELADQMEVVAPRAHAGVSLSSTGTLSFVRSEAKRLMNAGVPKEEAYTQAAQTQLNKGPLTIQQENDRLDATKKELNKMDMTAKVKEIFDPGLFSSSPVVAAELGEAYRRIREDATRHTGDSAVADRVAKEEMQRIYGPTGVGGARISTPAAPAAGTSFDGGTPIAPNDAKNPGPSGSVSKRITMYPPERYKADKAKFLTDDQYSMVVQLDLEKQLKDRGITAAPSKDASGLPPIRLEATDQTAADVRSGQLPRYQVQVLRGDRYEAIPGMPLYRVPTDKELEAMPAWQQYTQARVNNDAEIRKQYEIEQKEISDRRERNTAPTGRPSQMPQPLAEPSRKRKQ